VGTVLLPAAGFAALRMAQAAAGIPPAVVAMRTVNRQCASGLQAVADIANSIRSGEIGIGIGAGVESMSCFPMDTLKPVEVDWKIMGQIEGALDCLMPMGITSDTVVREYGLERYKLDDFAAQSHQKAAAAVRAGKFVSEIVPVTIINKTNGTTTTVTADDGIRPQTTPEILSQLKPAFIPKGTTTAGNSSQTTDGAAAVLLMTRREAGRRGLPIVGIWRGFATAAVPPKLMGIGPAVAIPAVLKLVGLKTADIDVFEINEAFSSQASWCIETLGLDMAKINPNGGAIALGHPLGCTGARMIATLLPELHRRKARYGVVSMCIGTGMGAAAVIEVEPRSSL
jgi:acetyl-CoA acyltransferase 1